MLPAEIAQFVTNASQTFEAFNSKPLSEKAFKAWFYALKTFTLAEVTDELDGWLRTQRKPPTVAELIERLNHRVSNRVEKNAAQAKAGEARAADMMEGRLTPPVEARAQVRRIREMLAQAGRGPAARDALYWARRPLTGKAVDLLIHGARNDRRLRDILSDHLSDGGVNCRGEDARYALQAYAASAPQIHEPIVERQPGED